MKYATLLTTLVVGICANAHGAFSYQSGTINANIPDGNLSGWSSTVTPFNPSGTWTITGVSVTLNIAGGYNGDLYAYLSYGGHLITLLNRVGTGTGSPGSIVNLSGYSDPGMHVTLSDAGSVSVHLYNETGSGGQGPGTPGNPVTYNPDSSSSFSATFAGMNPNGARTLFIADRSGGGGTAQLQSWDLNVDAVPEPVNVALAIFGALVVGGTAGYRFLAARKPKKV